MRKNKFQILLLIIIAMSVCLQSKQKIIPLMELLKPLTITMDEKQLYISETGANILIYRADNYKFKKKFGKSGEGPGEFLYFALAAPLENNLMINSLGKVSYYSKNGVLQNEIKSTGGEGGGFGFISVEGGYISQGRAQDADGLYSVISFHDEKLTKIRELYRIKTGGKGLSKLEVLRSNIPYVVHNSILYVSERDGFKVNAIDKTGKRLFKIERKDYKPRKFTSEIEKEIHKNLKKNSPQWYQRSHKKFYFERNFPVFSHIYKDPKAEMLYLFTWKFKDSKYECFIYDMKGKFQKKTTIFFKKFGIMRVNPLMIYDWKVYQLIDNEETENWDMYITDVNRK